MKETKFKIEYKGSEEVMAQYADAVFLQMGKEIATITFYQNLLPLAGTMNDDGAFDAKSQCTGKFVIQRSTALRLKQILEENLNPEQDNG